MYQSPGFADNLNDELLTKWNKVIKENYDRQAWLESRFFKINPDDIKQPTSVDILWFGDPAEPNFCMGPEIAQQLSDWGTKGRHQLQNEYAEYAIISRPDSTGKLRPKRVQITTELREYWVCIATYDPTQLRNMTKDILGIQPSWEDLYGHSDPFSLSEDQRRGEFIRLVAGNGSVQPTGTINTNNALFMSHPINGLDDLLYIVMFGSKPYAILIEGNIKQATKEQIFIEENVEHLACRHADPAAAMGAYGAVFHGRNVAFANPLGMYIQSFNSSLFTLQGEPIPENWIKFSRGQPATNDRAATFQRLDFGPPDDEPLFLDDIRVASGGSDLPLLGGFQILQQIEVGPLIIVGEETQIPNNEYVIVNPNVQPILCHQSSVCTSINRLKMEYDQAHPSMNVVRIGPRRIGTGI